LNEFFWKGERHVTSTTD